MAEEARLKSWEALFRYALQAIDSVRERRDAVLERLASADALLRKTFAGLDVLDCRPSYDECVGVLRKALAKA